VSYSWFDGSLSKRQKPQTSERNRTKKTNAQITQQGSKEGRTTLMMKDKHRKEIKQNEEITQINIRMKCIFKKKDSADLQI
jgi:hypothetical protein